APRAGTALAFPFRHPSDARPDGVRLFPRPAAASRSKATLMAKNVKRPTVSARPRKQSVNGHGLAHDDGFPGGDDFDAPAPAAANGDEEFGWHDDEDHNPHGDDHATVDATDDPVRMYLMQM